MYHAKFLKLILKIRCFLPFIVLMGYACHRHFNLPAELLLSAETKQRPAAYSTINMGRHTQADG